MPILTITLWSTPVGLRIGKGHSQPLDRILLAKTLLNGKCDGCIAAALARISHGTYAPQSMIETRIRTSIDAYVAAWNERDPVERMRLISLACTEDLIMRTPGRRIEGRAQLDALMADFQQRRPGERAVLSSAVDVQGHVFRYAGRVEGSTTSRGDTFDAGECADDGRIRFLLTFVGASVGSETLAVSP